MNLAVASRKQYNNSICFLIEIETEKHNYMEEKKFEKEVSSGYYTNQPKIEKKGMSKIRQQFNRGMSAFLVVAAAIIFYFALFNLDMITGALKTLVSVSIPTIYGLAIAFLLNPIVKKVDKYLCPYLEKKFSKKEKAQKVSRTVGIFTALVSMLAIIVALCNMMLPELYASIRDMILKVPGQLTNLIQQWNEMEMSDTTLNTFAATMLEEGTEILQTWLKEDLLPQTNAIMTSVTAGVIGVAKGLLNFVVGIIISIYTLYSKETFSAQCKKVVYAMLKPHQANMLLHITQKSSQIFSGFLIGKIIDSAIIGVLCFVGLSFLNMPYTLLVSVIVGVTNVIPFFGPYIGAIPSAILILLEDPKMGLYFIIFIFLLQQLDGNVIGPKILGDSTGLSAFWVVFAILAGGGLFGIPGMILGVPTFAVIYYIVTMIINHKLEMKNLPTCSEFYDEYSYVEADGSYVHSNMNENKCKKEEE